MHHTKERAPRRRGSLDALTAAAAVPTAAGVAWVRRRPSPPPTRTPHCDTLVREPSCCVGCCKMTQGWRGQQILRTSLQQDPPHVACAKEVPVTKRALVPAGRRPTPLPAVAPAECDAWPPPLPVPQTLRSMVRDCQHWQHRPVSRGHRPQHGELGHVMAPAWRLWALGPKLRVACPICPCRGVAGMLTRRIPCPPYTHLTLCVQWWTAQRAHSRRGQVVGQCLCFVGTVRPLQWWPGHSAARLPLLEQRLTRADGRTA
jgi:hypothetical protein